MATLVTLPRAPDWRMPSRMNLAGAKGEAPRNPIAELDADAAPSRAPRALVFDSGLGGLSVLAEIRRLRPDVEIVYAADDAAFPYGRLGEAELVARVETVMARSHRRNRARYRRHRLQHRLHLGSSAAEGRLSATAVRRHGAGDQAGGGGVAVGTDQRAGDARHRGARLHPCARARSCRAIAR